MIDDKMINLRQFDQEDGSIIPIELEKEIPFKVQRIFYIKNVPQSKTRGEHAHKKCHQLLIPISGSFKAYADFGKQSLTFEMDSKRHEAFHAPPMTWLRLSEFSPGAVLLVLASEKYDPEDYVETYDEFLNHSNRVQ